MEIHDGPCGTSQFLHLFPLIHGDLVITGWWGDCETMLKLEPGRVRSLHFNTGPNMLAEDLCWSGEGVFRQNEKNKDQAVSFSAFTYLDSSNSPRFLGSHTLFSVKWFWGSLCYCILKLGWFRAKPISTVIPLAMVIFFFLRVAMWLNLGQWEPITELCSLVVWREVLCFLWTEIQKNAIWVERWRPVWAWSPRSGAKGQREQFGPDDMVWILDFKVTQANKFLFSPLVLLRYHWSTLLYKFK